jgi:hypothetical protein
VKNGSQIGVIEPAGSTYFANFAHEKAAMVFIASAFMKTTDATVLNELPPGTIGI